MEELYALYENTSAPCSKRAYFSLDLLKCTFPKDKKRECITKLGLSNGWNQLVYKYKID